MKRNRSYMGFVSILGFGLLVTTSALVGLYVGTLLDRRSGKTIFAPLFLLAGLLAGFHRAYMSIKSVLNKDR